jgi:hypothetical protein
MKNPTASDEVQMILNDLNRDDSKEIPSDRFWFKVVEFLQTNWAIIDEQSDATARVWFINDSSGVFDSMSFRSLEEAVSGLMDNGFDLWAKNLEVQRFIAPPTQPFKRDAHPNGQIYSGGKFWINNGGVYE